MKIFVIGSARHGKDTVADIIHAKYGLTFESSSMFCAEHVVRPYLAGRGITYASLDECFSDRMSPERRLQWMAAIKGYNTPDLSRLSGEIFKSYDMYVGIRSRAEFLESRHLADLNIWVEGSQRVDFVDPTCEVQPGDCDIIIDNNSTEADLEKRVVRLFDLLTENRKKVVKLPFFRSRDRRVGTDD